MTGHQGRSLVTGTAATDILLRSYVGGGSLLSVGVLWAGHCRGSIPVPPGEFNPVQGPRWKPYERVNSLSHFTIMGICL